MVFAFFVFDFGDEDTLLHRFDAGDVPCSSELFHDLLNFSCLVLLLLFQIQFLIFLLISRIRFFHASQSSSFHVWRPAFHCLSLLFPALLGASVASAATALLIVMSSSSVAAVNAAVAAHASASSAAAFCASALASGSVASFVVAFLVLFGSASLTSRSKSLYISSCSSSHVSPSQPVRGALLRWGFLFALGISNCAITHLWSLPMSIVSLASASLLQQWCFLSIKM